LTWQASALRSKAAVRREVQEKRQLVRRTGPSGRKNASPPAAAFESDEATPLVRRLPIKEGVMRNLYTNERLFENLFGFRREFDEMFNRIFTGKPWGLELPEFKKTFNITPAVEAYVDKEAKKYVCHVTLPGVEPKDLQIHAQGNVVTIRGERKLTHSAKEIELMEGEIFYGVFERALELPEGVNVEKLTAEYVNGVLEITAPVAAAALPRKIEIKTTAPFVKQIAA
jgi:HSP20 family protein